MCLIQGMKVGFQVLRLWGGGESVAPEPYAFKKAHFIMIQQLHLITPFANEHKRQLREENSNRDRVWLAKMHMQGFNMLL
jgi:hypothetical protein